MISLGDSEEVYYIHLGGASNLLCSMCIPTILPYPFPYLHIKTKCPSTPIQIFNPVLHA